MHSIYCVAFALGGCSMCYACMNMQTGGMMAIVGYRTGARDARGAPYMYMCVTSKHMPLGAPVLEYVRTGTDYS